MNFADLAFFAQEDATRGGLWVGKWCVRNGLRIFKNRRRISLAGFCCREDLGDEGIAARRGGFVTLTLQRKSGTRPKSGAGRLGRLFRPRSKTLGVRTAQAHAKVFFCSARLLKRHPLATQWAAEAAAPLEPERHAGCNPAKDRLGNGRKTGDHRPLQRHSRQDCPAGMISRRRPSLRRRQADVEGVEAESVLLSDGQDALAGPAGRDCSPLCS